MASPNADGDDRRPTVSGPRRLRHLLVLALLGYAIAGTVSQKLVPGVDEVFPFFGWSLFSRVPAVETRYVVRIEVHDGRTLEPPVTFLHAPDRLVQGNRYIGRKVVQRLGRAYEAGDAAAIRQLRRQFERNYLVGETTYSLGLEEYEPLEMWRTGEAQTRRHLDRFSTTERIRP